MGNIVKTSSNDSLLNNKLCPVQYFVEHRVFRPYARTMPWNPPGAFSVAIHQGVAALLPTLACVFYRWCKILIP